MSDPNCVFCKIIAGDIPSAAIYRDEHLLAFLDIGPLAEGHILLVPLGHHEGLSDMPADIAAIVCSHIPKFGRAVLEATGAPAFNLLCNTGREAGQEVMHVHFHLIPRAAGDGLGYRWNAGTYEEGRIQEWQQKFERILAG